MIIINTKLPEKGTTLTKNLEIIILLLIIFIVIIIIELKKYKMFSIIITTLIIKNKLVSLSKTLIEMKTALTNLFKHKILHLTITTKCLLQIKIINNSSTENIFYFFNENVC